MLFTPERKQPSWKRLRLLIHRVYKQRYSGNTVWSLKHQGEWRLDANSKTSMTPQGLRVLGGGGAGQARSFVCWLNSQTMNTHPYNTSIP